MTTEHTIGDLFSLIMVQPTSQCNINCSYCYLSLERRKSKNVMTLDVIIALAKSIFRERFPKRSKPFNILWHAGEPLAVPISFYRDSIKIFDRYNEHNYPVNYSLLTNGVAVTDAWCELFKCNNFEIGISIDGPDFLHDIHRRSWNNKGTFQLALKGLKKLQANDIYPYALSTIHLKSLDHPQELYQFYKENGISRVGFNFEEIIGHNNTSSLKNSAAISKAKNFIETMYNFSLNDPDFSVREFESMTHLILKQENIDNFQLDTLTPFSILTVSVDGAFSTFAPELADVNSQNHGNFIFGNLLTDTIEDAIESIKLKKVHDEIKAGVTKCREECQYYSVCGANLPAHKLTENGTFNSTHTQNCNISIKMVADTIVDHLLK